MEKVCRQPKVEKIDYIQHFYRYGTIKYLIIENVEFSQEQWDELKDYISQTLDCAFDRQVKYIKRQFGDSIKMYNTSSKFRVIKNCGTNLVFAYVFEHSNPITIEINYDNFKTRENILREKRKKR